MKSLVLLVLLCMSAIGPVKQISLPQQGTPVGISSGAGSDAWVAAGEYLEHISSGKTTSYSIADGVYGHVAVDATGAAWFVTPKRIGVVRGGVVAYYSISVSSELFYEQKKIWFISGGNLYSNPPHPHMEYVLHDTNLTLSDTDGSTFWFYRQNTITKLQNKHVTTYNSPDPVGGLVGEPGGGAWFTGVGEVGHLDKSGKVHMFRPAGISDVLGAGVWVDEAYWFTDIGGVYRITASGKVDDSIGLGARDLSPSLSVGPNNTLWFLYPTGYNDSFSYMAGEVRV